MYTITFNDDTTFIGGPVNDSKWNDMGDKIIRRIDYQLGNKILVSSGFEAYNHLVERVYINSKETITKLLFMGKLGDNVTVVTIPILFQNYTYIFDIQNITKSNVKYGQEYEGRPTTGWKSGYAKVHGVYNIK